MCRELDKFAYRTAYLRKFIPGEQNIFGRCIERLFGFQNWIPRKGYERTEPRGFQRSTRDQRREKRR